MLKNDAEIALVLGLFASFALWSVVGWMVVYPYWKAWRYARRRDLVLHFLRGLVLLAAFNIIEAAFLLVLAVEGTVEFDNVQWRIVVTTLSVPLALIIKAACFYSMGRATIRYAEEEKLP